jgi:hypothetical protein
MQIQFSCLEKHRKSGEINNSHLLESKLSRKSSAWLLIENHFSCEICSKNLETFLNSFDVIRLKTRMKCLETRGQVV